MAEEIFSLTPINSGRCRQKASLTLRKSKIKKELESLDRVKAECKNSLENLPPQIAKIIEKPRSELPATGMNQSGGKLQSNPSAADKKNLFPRTNGIRVKALDELSNCAEKQIDQKSEIIELSSDEELLKDFKPSTRKTRRKQLRSPQTPNTLSRRKLRGKRNVKTEMEKVVINRKLTKSTNLKTFSSKYQPASQKSIQQYFKSVDRTDRVGYYETFEKSSVRKPPKLQPVNLIEKFEQVENAAAPADPQWNTMISKDSLIDDETRANFPQFLKFLEISSKHSGAVSGPQSLADFNIFATKSTNVAAEQIAETGEMEVRPDKSLSETQSVAAAVNESHQKDCRSSPKLFESSATSSSQNTSQLVFGRVRKRLTFNGGSKIDEKPIAETEQLQASAGEIIDLSAISSPEEDKPKTSDRCKFVSTTGTSKKSRDKRKAGCTTPIKKDKRKRAECPAYKIIENTTFAVDAFRYGEIDGISHYFLSHFHADHYIGLSKKFQRPVYLSEISASLVRTFLRTRSEYLHVINIDEPININGVEIVAVDANHCPGALMFIFKFDTGLCTLHTGDFRASPEMEEGPTFWNYRINTIYLDTTYLSSKYMFKSQWDSISDTICAIHDFRERHIGEKILYVFGSYVIGKEKMWTKLADDYNWRIWTDENRRKALDAIGNREFLKRLVNDPNDADMHILTIGNLSYDYLSQYLNQFCEFSMIFAIRASGWEKNSKPQYRGRVNIFGVEYSEHSSYEELRRFVQFIQPTKIISTVPTGSDMSRTSKIPLSWYNNRVCSRQKGFQSSITNFIRVKDKRNKLAESTSRAINEIDRAKHYDSGSGDDMLAIDATLTSPKKDDDVIDSVFDWMS